MGSSQIATTMPDDLLLECGWNVLCDTKYLTRRGAVVLKPYIPQATERTFKVIQQPEMNSLLIVLSVTHKACLIRPYDVGKKLWLNLQTVHNEVVPIISSLIIPFH
ncbi:hypothetical protein TNCV_3073961 [Trichonephila clavipes]|nr:hypothetical protein TNCV_3073961 [Trichonephila clavipes]